MKHRWVLWADEAELKRLRKLAAASHRGIVEYPAELTTPKELSSLMIARRISGTWFCGAAYPEEP